MAVAADLHDARSSEISSEPAGLTRGVILSLAFACGLTTANVYYAQSIAGPIAAGLNLPPGLAGLIVTTTQLGYGLGLFFVVSLADLVENRRLVLMSTFGTVLSAIWVACSNSAASFFLASLVLGICAVGSQILLPLAVHMTPERLRGQTIGSIMGGLVTGVMLARPAASFITAHWGWRATFVLSAVLMSGTLLLLARNLPKWQPRPGRGYLAILTSTLRLLGTVRTLQRRAAYQGMMFLIFNVFWTGAPLMLHTRFGFGQVGIAAFALVGAAGALSAPIAGRIADRGKSKIGTAAVLLCAAIAFAISGWGHDVGSISILILAAIILDASVQANQVFGQRMVQSIDPTARGRLNAGYMTVIFLCGGIGSLLGSLTYYYGGWWTTAAVGAGLGLVIFGVFLTEPREPKVVTRAP